MDPAAVPPEVAASLVKRFEDYSAWRADVAARIVAFRRWLHVNELARLLQQRFGRLADRDTLSSALAKKARGGILLRQPAPATFALIDSEEDKHAKT